MAQQSESPQTPIRTLRLSVDKGARDAFFQQLKLFAEKNGFSISVANVRPGGEHFSVEMQRSDFYMVVINSFDIEKFRIYLYSSTPANANSSSVDALVSEIKLALGQIKGIAFYELQSAPLK